VLALPTTLHQIGLIPGLILMVFSGIITSWGCTVISMFKRGHPEVFSVADVGSILAGRIGREVLGVMYWVSPSP
jgi:amino acid permease